MTEHVHLWASDGQCRGCGLNANVLVQENTYLLNVLKIAVTRQRAEASKLQALVAGRPANP